MIETLKRTRLKVLTPKKKIQNLPAYFLSINQFQKFTNFSNVRKRCLIRSKVRGSAWREDCGL